MKINLNIVGCGGVGLKVARELAFGSPIPFESVTLWDSDLIEDRNLERQIFNADQVGMSKASATAELFFPDATIMGDLKAESLLQNGYIDGTWPEASTWVITTDNIESRLLLLDTLDEFGNNDSIIISGANATADDGFGIGSTAWVYKKKWSGSDKDPRVRDNLKSQEDINLGRPCTETSDPQTAIANSGACQRVVEMLVMYCSPNSNKLEKHLASQHSLFYKQVAL